MAAGLSPAHARAGREAERHGSAAPKLVSYSLSRDRCLILDASPSSDNVTWLFKCKSQHHMFSLQILEHNLLKLLIPCYIPQKPGISLKNHKSQFACRNSIQEK